VPTVLLPVIGDMLPAALGIALSPFPVVAIILVLGTEQARRSGPAFTLGWLVGLSALTALTVFVFSSADTESSWATALAWIRVGIGLLLLWAAWHKWAERPRPGDELELPGWMASIESMEPSKVVVLGAGLGGVNPKNIALTLAGTSAICEAGLEGGDALVAALVFVLLSSLFVIGAVVAYLVGGQRAEAPLGAIKDFMLQHNTVIVMIVFALLGAKVLGDGLAGI
jgi:threonine/homoserine/homoserine lactone efflux protein